MALLSLCEGNEGVRAAHDASMDKEASKISMTQNVTNAVLCGNMNKGRHQLMHKGLNAPCLQMENGEPC